MPNSPPKPYNKMRHNTTLISSMSMRSPSRCPDNVPRLKSPWNTTLITNPAIAGNDLDHLSLLMGMPVSSGTGGECDVGDCCFGVEVYGIEIDVASECFGRLCAFLRLGCGRFL